MIGYTIEEETTVVRRYRFDAPTNWNEVMKVFTHVQHALNDHHGRPLDHTPYDDEIWFEPYDEQIQICYRISQTTAVRE